MRGAAASNVTRGGILSKLAPTLAACIAGLVLYALITAFALDPVRIPSGSMIPTLRVGDWMLVNKLIYGQRVPLMTVRTPGYAAPGRGDVVVFRRASAAAEDGPASARRSAATRITAQEALVKRIVGVPGDTLLMRDGVLSVNGSAEHVDWRNSQVAGDPHGRRRAFHWQHLVELHGSRFGDPPAAPSHDTWGPLLVPRNQYFVLGDNRYCSRDSRHWGFVRRDDLIGRALVIYYSAVPGPAGTAAPCDGPRSPRPLAFLTDIRWDRIGAVIR